MSNSLTRTTLAETRMAVFRPLPLFFIAIVVGLMTFFIEGSNRTEARIGYSIAGIFLALSILLFVFPMLRFPPYMRRQIKRAKEFVLLNKEEIDKRSEQEGTADRLLEKFKSKPRETYEQYFKNTRVWGLFFGPHESTDWDEDEEFREDTDDEDEEN